jgi:hypothetical protein
VNLIRRLLIASAVLVLPVTVFAQQSGELDTGKIENALGRPGQKIGDVYKVGFPRTDLHVTVHGVTIKPGLALGSWAAFTGTDGHAMVMGDLVLLEDELNPVMEKLRAASFEITAVHNHLLDETPRVMYLHYMGHGVASELAASLRGVLAASKTPLLKPAAAAEETAPPSWVRTIEESLGRKGTLKSGVLSYAVPRAEEITLVISKDPLGGTKVPPAAGVAEAVNFQAADAATVATTGDFVLTAEEVNLVISALEAHGIQVTALHSHMLTEQPRLFFMHFWAVGPAQSVAEGIKAALEKVHTK